MDGFRSQRCLVNESTADFIRGGQDVCATDITSQNSSCECVINLDGHAIHKSQRRACHDADYISGEG